MSRAVEESIAAAAALRERAKAMLAEADAAEPMCECGHPIAKHHNAPRCRCGHLRLAHYGTTKDGRTHLPTGCGERICACTVYEPEGLPVRSFCGAQPKENHHYCGCREPRLVGGPK